MYVYIMQVKSSTLLCMSTTFRYAAHIASATTVRKPPRSSSYRAEAVVPPGEVTLFFSVGMASVDSCSESGDDHVIRIALYGDVILYIHKLIDFLRLYSTYIQYI